MLNNNYFALNNKHLFKLPVRHFSATNHLQDNYRKVLVKNVMSRKVPFFTIRSFMPEMK
jgi:hypothetical protein